jgi:putative transposase
MAVARAAYPSDLSAGQWGFIEPLIPKPKSGGRPHAVDVREVVNGILYVLRTGCSWRQLPHDLPPWGTVYWYFWTFRREGVREKIHDALREKVRVKERRQTTPSTGIVDSQSAKTRQVRSAGGPDRRATEKGGSAVTMRARRSMAASATSSLTRSA